MTEESFGDTEQAFEETHDANVEWRVLFESTRCILEPSQHDLDELGEFAEFKTSLEFSDVAEEGTSSVRCKI
jgi:hypothetical protein